LIQDQAEEPQIIQKQAEGDFQGEQDLTDFNQQSSGSLHRGGIDREHQEPLIMQSIAIQD
jgi:hypothetical protein